MPIENKFISAQREMLAKLENCEGQVADLYAEFARVLPQMAEFWNGVAAEERGHAAQFRSLNRLLDKRALFQNLTRFDIGRFDSFLARLRADLAAAGDALTAERSLSMALALERTSVECGFFTTATSDAAEYREIAKHLAESESEHIRRIERRLQHSRCPAGVVGSGSDVPSAPGLPPPSPFAAMPRV